MEIEKRILNGLKSSPSISMLGIDILGVNILAVKATPEMAKALETETRELLQQDADRAIYERRNFAVEPERIIRESELNTEIAIEEKQKQIEQKRMESEVQRVENSRKIREMNVAADIAVENQRKELIDQKTANDKKEAEVEGYQIEVKLRPYKEMDWRALSALTGRTDTRNNIALAFGLLAENANKIGTLNITPDLLETLMDTKKATR